MSFSSQAVHSAKNQRNYCECSESERENKIEGEAMHHTTHQALKTWIAISAIGVSLSLGSLYESNAQGSSQRPRSQQQEQRQTPENRERMAKMHEEMAKCLRSDKNWEDCHKQMMRNCPMVRNGECVMMGKMQDPEPESDGREQSN
jgi:hypothetical protein